ncbi:MAG TPA: hypothetical protein DEA45_00720 [Acholeplasmataceae bacterium]|nr:hypothetical protein [Acholeplasmataceae bacterium]
MAYKSKFATKEIDKLFEAILTLESVEECYKLFEDLCTIKEIQDMSQRLLVAKLLNEGVSYQNILPYHHLSSQVSSTWYLVMLL